MTKGVGHYQLSLSLSLSKGHSLEDHDIMHDRIHNAYIARVYICTQFVFENDSMKRVW